MIDETADFSIFDLRKKSFIKTTLPSDNVYVISGKFAKYLAHYVVPFLIFCARV